MFTRTKFNQLAQTHGLVWAQYVAQSFGVSKTQIELWTLQYHRPQRNTA